jgi:hypothetical protein
VGLLSTWRLLLGVLVPTPTWAFVVLKPMKASVTKVKIVFLIIIFLNLNDFSQTK